MKNIIWVLALSSTFSAFANNVVDFKTTSYGVKASISYGRACTFVGPVCLSYPHKWEKSVDCELENGVLTAYVNYEYDLTFCQNSKVCKVERWEMSLKNVRLKVEGMCDGKSPSEVYLNDMKVL